MKIIITMVLAFMLISCQTNNEIEHSMVFEIKTEQESLLSIIPYPRYISQQSGTFQLGLSVNVVQNPLIPTSMLALKTLLSELNVKHDSTAKQQVKLVLVEQSELSSEGYQVTIDENILISANTDKGLFYGVQTLRQLLPTAIHSAYSLPKLTIIDSPENEWRGSMLDVARSFLPIEYLKSHIDRMSLFKLNKLHLHLSDDQGWRVEIKQYPRLTEIGGKSAVEGGRSGFYSQDELKDLVTYAAQRHVDIIPEVDLPGHTQAALASYNELACDDVENLSLYSGTKVGFSKLCITKPDIIYPFVKGVLTELTQIFPSQYIHIGGDEIEDPDYKSFIEEAAKIVKGLGRITVAWEEASVAKSDILLQLWNDSYDIQPALDRGQKMILSPCSYTYLDHGNYANQPNTYDWCTKEGVSLERVYSLNPQKYNNIVGVESPVWSELVHDDDTADNRLWPRLVAIAEVSWSTQENRNYKQFLSRLSVMKPRFDKLNINYYREPQLKW